MYEIAISRSQTKIEVLKSYLFSTDEIKLENSSSVLVFGQKGIETYSSNQLSLFDW